MVSRGCWKVLPFHDLAPSPPRSKKVAGSFHPGINWGYSTPFVLSMPSFRSFIVSLCEPCRNAGSTDSSHHPAKPTDISRAAPQEVSPPPEKAQESTQKSDQPPSVFSRLLATAIEAGSNHTLSLISDNPSPVQEYKRPTWFSWDLVIAEDKLSAAGYLSNSNDAPEADTTPAPNAESQILGTESLRPSIFQTDESHTGEEAISWFERLTAIWSDVCKKMTNGEAPKSELIWKDWHFNLEQQDRISESEALKNTTHVSEGFDQMSSIHNAVQCGDKSKKSKFFTLTVKTTDQGRLEGTCQRPTVA